jgi:hypothetical protein
LPTSIFFVGAEGAGNPDAGCQGPNMYVYPDGNGPDPCVVYPLYVDAGADKTVYYGWNPEECTNLSVNISGDPTYPLTYNWSNGNNNPSISVCPSSNTTYMVTVTDNNGCTATDEVLVNVIDVRCGKKNNKVLLCKPNGTTTVCVKFNTVQQKLNQGFTLGSCNNAFRKYQINSRSLLDENEFRVFPTLFSDILNVEVDLEDVESLQLNMYDMLGTMVKNISNVNSANQTIEIPTQDLAAQTYFLQIILDSGEVSTFKVIKTR